MYMQWCDCYRHRRHRAVNMSRYPTRPVEPVKESYYCPHCTNVLRAAVQTIEGDRLCENCCEEIRGMPSSKCAKCEICVPPGSLVYPDRAARREISVLVVYCPYVDTGCGWRGKLKDMEEHARQCSFKRVKCPHSGCEVWMTTSQLELHVRECVYRQVHCKYCGQDMQYNQLVQHYERICQEYPEPCKQCGKAVSRKDMPHHLEEVCGIVQCKVCQQLVNRETKQEVAKGHNGPVHLSNATTIFEHTQALARRQDTLKTSVQELQENVVSVEHFKQLQSRVETLAVDVNTKSSMNEFDGDLRTQLQKLEKKLTSLHSTHSYQPSGLHSESTADNRIMHLEKCVEELQRTTALIKVHMAELELQPQASLASTHNGTFLWRLPKIHIGQCQPGIAISQILLQMRWMGKDQPILDSLTVMLEGVEQPNSFSFCCASNRGQTTGSTYRIPLDSRPRLDQFVVLKSSSGEVVKVKESVCSRWRAIATQLHFSPGLMETIQEKANTHGPEAAFDDVMTRWLNGTMETRQPVVWKTLLEVL